MKNILKLTSLFILLIFAASACNDSKTEVADLETEVIAIHDIAMAKTDQLFQLKKELQSTLSTTADSIAVFDIIKSLDNADEEMMVWMDQYEAPNPELSKEKNLASLNDQKAKIINVQTSIDNAIEKATSYLK